MSSRRVKSLRPWLGRTSIMSRRDPGERRPCVPKGAETDVSAQDGGRGTTASPSPARYQVPGSGGPYTNSKLFGRGPVVMPDGYHLPCAIPPPPLGSPLYLSSAPTSHTVVAVVDSTPESSHGSHVQAVVHRRHSTPPLLAHSARHERFGHGNPLGSVGFD